MLLNQEILGEAHRYLANAYALARQSKDKSNQNGAILLPVNDEMSTGINNFPPGVKFTDDRATTRPTKYRYFEHAERAAVYLAARVGKATYGSTVYCPWASCCDCARSMICAGVANLVVHHERMQMTPERWIDDVNEALSMLKESGIKIHYYEGIVKAQPVLVNGELWSPDSPVQKSGNWFVGMNDEVIENANSDGQPSS